MTIQNNTPRTSLLSTGAATISSTFQAFTADQIDLFIGTTLANQGVDYTVGSLTGNTFNLTLTPAQTPGTKLTILRDTPAQRAIDYQPLGNFDADTLDLDIDLVWMKLQEILEQASRQVTLAPTTAYTGNLTLPDPIIGSYLYANPDGTLIWSPPQNANSIVQADTATAGITRYATDAEVAAQTNTASAVRPSSMPQLSATNAQAAAMASTSRWLTPGNVGFLLSEVTLTDAATVTPDMATGTSFKWTLAGNRTLALPANPIVGESFYIRMIQDATGTRTITFASGYVSANGERPVLSTAAAAEDYLQFRVLTTGRILVSALSNLS